MTPEKFAESIRQHVRDAAVDDVVSTLDRPPGRRPEPELLELAAWYSRLSPDDKEHIRRVLALVADYTVFGMFAVLDGARTLEGREPKGRFELRFVAASGEVSEISDGRNIPLHELL